MSKSHKALEFILFSPGQKCVPFVPGETVLEAAEANRIGLSHSCGGMGSCGTCRVIVESDLHLLPERNEIEAEMAQDRGFPPQERLACQLRSFAGLRVRVPDLELEDEEDLP